MHVVFFLAGDLCLFSLCALRSLIYIYICIKNDQNKLQKVCTHDARFHGARIGE